MEYLELLPLFAAFALIAFVSLSKGYKSNKGSKRFLQLFTAIGVAVIIMLLPVLLYMDDEVCHYPTTQTFQNMYEVLRWTTMVLGITMFITGGYAYLYPGYRAAKPN